MSLKIYLLGQFKILVSDQLLEIPSRPAQFLFAYLVMHPGITQRRERLASLLWSETNESNARSYLRQALWRIRKALESGGLNVEEYLIVSNISVTFQSESEYWLDVELFLDADESSPLEGLITTVSLYRGEFLPGFYEEWVLSERERLQTVYHQKANWLVERLIKAGEWETALEWSECWIQLGELPEPAYRAMMKAYAGLGDLGMVSATYQRCLDSLQRELEVEPSYETQRLYENIRAGNWQQYKRELVSKIEFRDQLPSFLDENSSQVDEKTFFVARQHELDMLGEFLDLVLAGWGRVGFVIGEAGGGKTSLLGEFTHRVLEEHESLVVVSGNCNAYTGVGDPYLPFREILELLTGDVEARWKAGAMTAKHACRLWNMLPLTVQGMLDAGPDLVDTFIARGPLLKRASANVPGGADWLERLKALMQRTPLPHNPGQSDLFEQYTRLMQTLARQVPLVLLIDDLQWADPGSINLLFHLGRQLAGYRILILGAYRPEDLSIGREGERHPLEPVVHQFQRDFGEITINLGSSKSRDFMDALLDSEPNQLGIPFRDMLFRQTGGHPLFTVELLRGMQERGDLVGDSEKGWFEGPVLDWDTLPARVEAVIAERIGRLPHELATTLAVASVEGEVFTAEVVAKVMGTEERQLVQKLSSELDRQHRLVRAHAFDLLGEKRISRYRFRNGLYQKYLYDHLDQVERSYLHQDIGRILEEIHGERSSEIAVQLAWHFEESGTTQKAIDYLYLAGERAVQLSAYQQATSHIKKGLALVQSLPNHQVSAQLELNLQLALGKAWAGAVGAQSLELHDAYTRAGELCRYLGKKRELCQVLLGLGTFYYVRSEHHKALELAWETVELAQQIKDPATLMLSHWQVGYLLFCLGDYQNAREHLAYVINTYDPQQHHNTLVSLRGSDAGPGALAYDACCLWCLGYPEQAMQRSQQALEIAWDLGHPFTIVDVICFAGCMFSSMRRDGVALKQHAEQLLQMADEKKLPGWQADGKSYLGKAQVLLGRFQEGIKHMRDGTTAQKSSNFRLNLIEMYCYLAEAQAKIGELSLAFESLKDAIILVEETGERVWEAELYRQQGDLHLKDDDRVAAETSYRQAIEIAQEQKARSWELRATISLARLWKEQDRSKEALQILSQIYNWFTEGFETPDLQEARTLLEVLSQG